MPRLDTVERIVADTSLPGGVECKTPRLDVVVVADERRIVDIEAQAYKVDTANKSLFYAAKLLVENTPKKSKDDYGNIPQVVAMVLSESETMFPDRREFLYPCTLQWSFGDEREPGPDRLVLVVADLSKVRRHYNEGITKDVLEDESLAWMYLLASGYKNPEEVKLIVEKFPTMEEFAQRYGMALGDPDLKRAYDRYWMNTLEYNSIMGQAKRDGHDEGRAEGRAEGRMEAVPLCARLGWMMPRACWSNPR